MPSGRPAKRRRSALGERLATLRKEHGLSQQTVAAALGVRQQVVAYLERNATKLRPKHASTLARLFGVSVGELIGEAPSRERDFAPVTGVRKLCDEIGRLPPHHQEQIVKVVSVLIAQAKAS